MTVANILTVDLEDWYHICGVRGRIPPPERLESRVVPNARRILERLAHRRVRATFFVLGVVAERHPGLIREIAEAGHEIALHGHAHRRVYTLDREGFRRDLLEARDRVSNLAGREVRGYRAPEWSIREDSLWALDVLREEGFAYDSSMAPLPLIGSRAYPVIPHRVRKGKGGDLWEFPPLVGTTRLLSVPLGGGWGLRLFPFAWVRSAVRGLNRAGHPAVIFLHPREFDPAPPRIPLPLVKRFVLHAGFEPTARRLERLLRAFPFGPVSDHLPGSEPRV